jgi:endonuclease III-like uncharacterized protein
MEWEFKALEKALTEINIKSGLHTIDIFPFNTDTIAKKMGPSEFYKQVPLAYLEAIRPIIRSGP